jgi:hypothetical protein
VVRKKTWRVTRDRGGLPAGNCRVRARNSNNHVKQMFHLTVSNSCLTFGHASPRKTRCGA